MQSSHLLPVKGVKEEILHANMFLVLHKAKYGILMDGPALTFLKSKGDHTVILTNEIKVCSVFLLILHV